MKNVKYLLARMRAQAILDPSYRAQLINDPKKVFSATLGVTLPKDLEINIIEDPENVASFVIPSKIAVETLYGSEIETIVAQMEAFEVQGRLGIEGYSGDGGITDSSFCNSLMGGGCTIFGCISSPDPNFFSDDVEMLLEQMHNLIKP